MTTETAPPSRPPGPSGESPPNTRSGTATGTALATLIAMVVCAPLCLLAVYQAPGWLRPEVAWSGSGAAVLLCAAVAVAAHQRLVGRQLRRQLVHKDIDAAAVRDSATHFAEVVVPDVVTRLHEGASVDTALAAAPDLRDETQRALLRTLTQEMHRGESLRKAAMAACANAAGRVQALTTSIAADLRSMQHRHSDSEVLGDLLHLDHRTAQTGRLADSIAVLTGARSGRRWAKPIRMESILRGAMGRISGYQRVRPHSTSTAAVAGHAAEGVMHALAEIMDNAANFSPPTAEVHVYVEEVSAGIVVTIEDGGLVMGEVALRRAQDAVSPRSARDLSALPGTRLGLAVVGRLAHKHGLTVAFRPSAHGGTGVLLRIPQELVTDVNKSPAGRPAPAAAPTPAAAPAPGGAPSQIGAYEGAGQTSGRHRAGSPETTGEQRAPQAGAPEGPAPDAHARGPATEAAATDTTEHRRAVGTEGPAGASGTGGEAAAPHDHDSRVGAPPATDASVDYGESGLPKRRRGQTLRSTQRGTDAGTAPRPARSPSDSGSRFGAFRRAVQSGQEDEQTAETGSPAPSPAPVTPPTLASSRPEEDAE